MTTPSELWPSHDSMKGYLETWVKYIYELEAKVRTLEAMSHRVEEALTADITKLSEQLADCVEPRERRIAELQEQVKGLERYTADVIADRQRNIERLAQLLEVPVTNATTLHDLIGQAMTLVAHTKQMFRERL